MLGAGLLRAKRAASPAARGLFEHRVGAETLPARGSGAAGLKLRRGRGGGLTPRPSPAMPPRPLPACAGSGSSNVALVLPARLSARRGRDPARGCSGARAGGRT